MVMRARQPGRIAQGGAPAQQHLGLLAPCVGMAVVHSGRATPAARRRPGGRSLRRSHGAECRRLLRGAQVGRMPLSIARPGLTILPLGRLDVDRRTAGGSASRPVHFAWARAGSAIGRRSFQCCGAHARSSFPHRSLVHDAGATEGRKKEQDGGLISKKFVAQQFRSQSRASPARGQLCREEDPDLASRLPSSRARPTLGPLPSRPCVGEAHGSKPPLFSKKARSWTF